MSLMTIKKVLVSLAIFVVLIATLACGGRVYVVKSVLPPSEVRIDGIAEEWQGALSFIEEEELFVGFLNDQNNLYVCLKAGDERSPARLMRQGLTVWFDPVGGNKKVFGIKYPLGGPPGGWNRQRMMDQPDDTQETRPRRLPDEMEILRSENESPEIMTLDQAKKQGLEVKASISEGAFVYELKIPLVISEGRAIAVGVRPNAVVGILFESGKLDQSRMQGRPTGGMGGGMGGGRGGMGGGPGRMGGGRAGMIPDIPEPIKIRARVQLVPAEKASPSLLLTLTHGAGDPTER
jgi:hypothetical protein